MSIAYEQLAQRQEEKLEKLMEISRLYRDMQTAIDRWEQQTFLVLWEQIPLFLEQTFPAGTQPVLLLSHTALGAGRF